VRFVSYEDAVAMADWLSQRDGRTYRLPTEEEWEKAAAWDTSLQKHWNWGFLSDNITCSWANLYQNGNCTSAVTEVGHYNGADETNDATVTLVVMTCPATYSS